MTDPVSAGAIKVASVLLSGAKPLARKLTFDWRAASWAVRRAKKVGIFIPLKAMKIALADGAIREALESRDPVGLDAARHRIAELISGSSFNDQPAAVEALISIIRLGYMGASDPTAAVVASHEEISDKLSALHAAVTQDHANGERFEDNLGRISPTLAGSLRGIRDEVGAPAERMLAALVVAKDRALLLADWAQSRPSWLPSVASIDGWLGELAMDSNSKETAVKWLDSALELGASPRGYWKVRRMWAEPFKSDEEAFAYIEDVKEFPLVRGIIQSTSLAERFAILEEWSPDGPIENAIRLGLMSSYARLLGKLDEAISIGRNAYEDFGFTGPALGAVEALIERSTSTSQLLHATDLSDAASLALRIRDDRRRWGSASGSAVALAMKSYILLADVERAWSLSQPQPEGEATEAESTETVVREPALILMAERGLVEEALSRLDDSYSESTHLQIHAREAELLLDEERAISLWSEAIEATDDWQDKASICIRLAMKGVIDPFVEQMRPHNPDIANELTRIAELESGAPGAEERLRELAQDNFRLTHVLIAWLAKNGRTTDVIFTSERAAEVWGDADDWLRAARAHLELGGRAAAIDRANKALLVGGVDWGDKFNAHVILTEASFQLEDWASAATAASNLLSIRPTSRSGRWALVLSRYYNGDEGTALAAWKSHEGFLPPENSFEAAVWLALFRTYGSEMATTEQAVDIAREFASDLNVRNVAITALTTAPRDEDASGDDVAKLMAEYEREFPEAHGFQKVSIDDDDPAALATSLDALVHNGPDLTAIEVAISNGLAPIGLSSVFGNRFYCESLLMRSSSPRFVGKHQGYDEVEMARRALGSVVVVDATALLTLTLLPDESANFIFGRFAGTRSTTQQLIDANASRETLSRENPNNSARFELSSSEERELLAQRSARLVEWFRRTARVSNRQQDPVLLDGTGLPTGTWSSALDLAVRESGIFWCDDTATRRIALGAGIQSFGTVALVELAREDGLVDRTYLDAPDASLVSGWTVGVNFGKIAFELALQLDGGRPLGTAAALRWSGSADPAPKLEFMQNAMHAVIDDPEAVGGWAKAAATYCSAITDVPRAAVENQTLVLRNLLIQSWMSPSVLAFVMLGFKSAAASDWTQVFQSALRPIYRGLAQQHGYDAAGQILLTLGANLNDEDHQALVGVILER